MDYNVPTDSIPIVIVGRGAIVMLNLVNALKPEYDAVHTCLDVAPAIDEIPQILFGNKDVLPASNIGTNAIRKPGEERPFPKAVLVGGGMSQEEYDKIRKAVKDKLGREAPEGVHLLKATMDMYPKDLPPGEPPMELIIGVARKMLQEVVLREP